MHPRTFSGGRASWVRRRRVAIERAGSVGEVDTQLAALTDELTQAQVALVAAVKSLGA